MLPAGVFRDPVVETRKIVDKIGGDVDLLIAVMHMGMDNKYGVKDSDASDLADACPELDLIIASHDHTQIEGKLLNGVLAVENADMAQSINEVQMYYTGAPVSAAALFIMTANMKEGEIHKSDSSLIYKYANTLYKLQMTGAQLKQYMEWSVNYYNQYQPGDLTISFN